MTRHSKPPLSTITLIGAGNLAQAIGPALRKAGYGVEQVVARDNPESLRRARALARTLGAAAIRLKDAAPSADVIWLCHTDDALASTAQLLARMPGWKNKIVLHSSGALSSDVLAPLKRAGVTPDHSSHDDLCSRYKAKDCCSAVRG